MSRPAKWTLGIGIVLVLLLALVGGMWLIEVPFYLAFGWVSYLLHVLPRVEFDWATIGFASVAVGVFAFGLHWFLCWLASAIDSQGTSIWKPRWTFSMVAIALLLFVAGTAFVGIVHQVVWLARSPAPFLEGGIRKAARRNQSLSTVKQIALGAITQAEVQDASADSGSIASDLPIHSWQTHLLPYVEEAALCKQVRRDLSWDHPGNFTAFSTTVPAYQSPYTERDMRPHDHAGYSLTDYSANQRVVKDGHPIDFGGITDGASRTLMHGEALRNRRPWGTPGNVRDPADGINRSPNGFNGASGSGGVIFSFADGRAAFITETVDPQVLKALSTPAGGETLDGGSSDE